MIVALIALASAIAAFIVLVLISFLNDIARAELRAGVWTFVDWCLARSSRRLPADEVDDFLNELRSVVDQYKTDKRVLKAITIGIGHAIPNTYQLKRPTLNQPLSRYRNVAAAIAVVAPIAGAAVSIVTATITTATATATAVVSIVVSSIVVVIGTAVTRTSNDGNSDDEPRPILEPKKPR